MIQFPNETTPQQRPNDIEVSNNWSNTCNYASISLRLESNINILPHQHLVNKFCI